MQRIDKHNPTQEWISSLRRRFTTEAEVDRVLTRRLERRAGPGYTPVPLPTLVSGVESLLKAKIASASSVADARWLSGGASKLQMAFTLTWDRPGIGPEQTRMVLRMEPAESIVETSRLREFQLVKAFEGRKAAHTVTIGWAVPGLSSNEARKSDRLLAAKNMILAWLTFDQDDNDENRFVGLAGALCAQ